MEKEKIKINKICRNLNKILNCVLTQHQQGLGEGRAVDRSLWVSPRSGMGMNNSIDQGGESNHEMEHKS